jgi:hypothetical protein
VNGFHCGKLRFHINSLLLNFDQHSVNDEARPGKERQFSRMESYKTRAGAETCYYTLFFKGGAFSEKGGAFSEKGGPNFF